eukprot:TRINITY_DN2516_c0_g1_i1.p1 TRINITY_DN2516_c0_g1~~TRINITY_DN2516_c0_g1_i1.p1  ORF type:complete len:405 (+),score=125.09 TRINITY_DN2516_c0_g1_i1:51-1217(+)
MAAPFVRSPLANVTNRPPAVWQKGGGGGGGPLSPQVDTYFDLIRSPQVSVPNGGGFGGAHRGLRRPAAVLPVLDILDEDDDTPRQSPVTEGSVSARRGGSAETAQPTAAPSWGGGRSGLSARAAQTHRATQCRLESPRRAAGEAEVARLRRMVEDLQQQLAQERDGAERLREETCAAHAQAASAAEALKDVEAKYDALSQVNAALENALGRVDKAPPPPPPRTVSASPCASLPARSRSAMSSVSSVSSLLSEMRVARDSHPLDPPVDPAEPSGRRASSSSVHSAWLSEGLTALPRAGRVSLDPAPLPPHRSFSCTLSHAGTDRSGSASAWQPQQQQPAHGQYLTSVVAPCVTTSVASRLPPARTLGHARTEGGGTALILAGGCAGSVV